MPARIVAAMLMLFPLSSPAAWDQMNGPVPAVATHLAVHGGAIFLGEDETDAGDVFVSTDGGFQWRTARLHNAGTTAVLSHPSGFYAGTYIEGLYRTTDLGSTWTQVTGGIDPQTTIEGMATNGSAIFVSGDLGGQFRIFRSTDNGSSWTPVLSNPAAQWPALLSVNQLVLAGSSTFGLYRSTNLGASWSPAAGIPPSSNVTAIAQDGSAFYAGVCVPVNPAQGGIWRSTDSGASWTRISADLPTSALLEVRAIAFRNGAILAGQDANFGMTGLFRSTDGGVHWAEISTTLPVPDHILSLLAGGTDIIVGTPDGPWRSTDEGANWSPTGQGTAAINAVQSLLAHDAFLWVGLDGGAARGIWRTSDGGESWISGTGLPMNSVAQAFTLHGNALFAGIYGGERGIYRSLDLGLTWSRIGTGLSSSTILKSLHSVNGVLLAGAWEALYRSTDDGATWTVVPGLDQVNAFVDFDGALYAGLSTAGVQRSTDNGATWAPAGSGLGQAFVQALAVSGGSLFAGVWGGGVYKLEGSTWVLVGVTNNFIDDLLDVNGALVAAAALYDVLYISTDGGNSWNPFNEGYSAGEVYHLAQYGENVIAGSRGHSLWTRPVSEIPGAAAVGGAFAGSRTLRLDGAWPNPVRSTAAIRYSLSRPGRVALAVYDAAGREVRRLDPGFQTAGEHQIPLSASALPSGTYFYRLWRAGEGADGAGQVGTGRIAVIR